MTALSENGNYSIPDFMRTELNRIFASSQCSEEDTMKTINSVFKKYDYLIDTHTAVAYKVLSDYRAISGDDTTSVIVSTASPFKFCEAVLDALGHRQTGDGILLIDKLAEVTGCPIPEPLAVLKNETPKYYQTVTTSGMVDSVLNFVRS
jgi:threonine synthase